MNSNFYRTLPLMAAQRHGFYRRHGVEVQEERVRSSHPAV